MEKLSFYCRHVGFTLSLLAAATWFSGCSGKQVNEGEGGGDIASAIANADTNPMGDSDSGKAMGLQTVHFPYDSFTLDKQAKAILKANGDILKTNPGAKIQIEGHCDQRGGIQYNIALGEKRANATKKYLEDMGVGGERISTISYGKERPIDPGNSDDANARNRRANFVITSQ